MNQQSKYPKRLTATKIEIGSSVTGVLEDVFEKQDETKDGRAYTKNVIVLTIDGERTELSAAGNLKYLAERIAKEEFKFGDEISITRKADAQSKAGYAVSQFDVTLKGATPTAAPVNDVKAKLEALKAARAAKV